MVLSPSYYYIFLCCVFRRNTVLSVTLHVCILLCTGPPLRILDFIIFRINFADEYAMVELLWMVIIIVIFHMHQNYNYYYF